MVWGFSMADPMGITSFVLGLIDHAIKLVRWFRKKGGRASGGTSDTISFVQQRQWWAMGFVANEPAMQVESDWWITNATQTHVYILRAELKFRHGLRKKVLNQMQTVDKGTAGAMSEVTLQFWIVPPVRKEDEDFDASIVMIDNFNRRHNLGKVTFKGPRSSKFPA